MKPTLEEIVDAAREVRVRQKAWYGRSRDLSPAETTALLADSKAAEAKLDKLLDRLDKSETNPELPL